MDSRDTKRMEMFIRTEESRTAFPLACPDDSYGAELFDQLSQLIEDLRGRVYDQSRGQSSVRESSGSANAARDELEKRLEAIYQTVRVIAFKKPELEEKFRPPRSLSAQALLTLARTYGGDAIPLKAELIKRGLSADFIADLDAAAANFDAALNERTQRRGQRITATAEIDRVIDRGLKIIRELRVVVRNTYVNDSTKLALWESVSHIEKPTRKSRRKGSGGTLPPPAKT